LFRIGGDKRSIVLTMTLSNNLLIAGTQDGYIRMYNVESEELVHTLNPKYYIAAVAVDPTGNWLVYGGGATYIVILHLPTKDITAVLPTPSNVTDIVYNQDNGRILSVGHDRFISIWNITGQLEQRYETSLKIIRSLNCQLVDENKSVLTAAGPNNVIIYINDQYTGTCSS
jgi:WD40 repeat protein